MFSRVSLDDAFSEVWGELEETSLVTPHYGPTCHRIHKAWQNEGKPAEIAEFIRSRMPPPIDTSGNFDAVWQDLYEQGVTTNIGGSHYKRALFAYIDAGEPADVLPFIEARAPLHIDDGHDSHFQRQAYRLETILRHDRYLFSRADDLQLIDTLIERVHARREEIELLARKMAQQEIELVNQLLIDHLRKTVDQTQDEAAAELLGRMERLRDGEPTYEDELWLEEEKRRLFGDDEDREVENDQ